MREKSRDSPSPKPWRSRQAMSAPDTTRNLDLDLDSNFLSPSRIGGRETNLKLSPRESIAPIESPNLLTVSY